MHSGGPVTKQASGATLHERPSLLSSVSWTSTMKLQSQMDVIPATLSQKPSVGKLIVNATVLLMWILLNYSEICLVISAKINHMGGSNCSTVTSEFFGLCVTTPTMGPPDVL